jgi:hypothetical protein
MKWLMTGRGVLHFLIAIFICSSATVATMIVKWFWSREVMKSSVLAIMRL